MSAKCIKPNYIIGENVKGLLSRKTVGGENYIDLIKEAFEGEGYVISYKMLTASKYGLPQKRERLFIVGIKNTSPAGTGQTFVFPKEINDTTPVPAEPPALERNGPPVPAELWASLRCLFRSSVLLVTLYCLWHQERGSIMLKSDNCVGP